MLATVEPDVDIAEGRLRAADPERTCIVTRAKGAPCDMIRFVVGPGDIVVADVRQKLPGRGVWVSARKGRVAEAVRKQAFSRGFKRKVAVPPDLAAAVGELLERDCLQFLALANKAGQVTTGFGKVEEAALSGAVAGLVHASDAGADGVRKIGQALRRSAGAPARPRIELFSSDQLDLALGRSNVIHAALLPGSASAAFLARCRRLANYRSETLDPPEDDAAAEGGCG